MKSSDAIIKEIINIPASFKVRNISFYNLLIETGHVEKRAEIGTNEIEKELMDNAAVIDSWMQWSADKRTGSGWYFQKKDNGYIVGYYPSGHFTPLEFTDAYKACAAFINRELEEAALRI